jgi:hypothetical protein
MLIVRTAPVFQPEKAYIWHIFLSILGNVPYRIVWQNGLNQTLLELPSGAFLAMPDVFFTAENEATGYAAAQIPTQVQRFPSPFDSEDWISLWGDGRLMVAETYQYIGSDLAAAAFFMLSRWEEAVLPDRDAFGRFPASASLAVRYQFLERPVVHEWFHLIQHALIRLGAPSVWFPARQPALVLSCDVDHPSHWHHWSDRLRTLAGAATRSPKELAFWRKGPIWQPTDTFDTFAELAAFASGHPVQFNFLGARPKHFDCWYDLNDPQLRQLIRWIEAEGHTIGFHPSREAFDEPKRFDAEWQSVQALTQQPVVSGRHHYLRFSAPDTWQRWADAGLTTDSTVGYSDAEGFRCGIAVPFPVYNFRNRTMLNLYEQPLIVMDVTLALYQRYSPETAIERVLQLKAATEKVGGQFTVLWHNSSLNDFFWRPYRQVLATCC